MAQKKKGRQLGKKGGSVIEEELKSPVQKPKPKRQKKQSKGKHKR